MKRKASALSQNKSSAPRGSRHQQIYDLKEYVDCGGQSSIFTAIHLESGLHVAIKLGPRMKSKDDPAYMAHDRELRAYTALGAVSPSRPSHPGIAQVYNQGLRKSSLAEHVRPWIAMQLLGPSLDKMVDCIAASTPIFFHFAQQALSALQFCHKHGVLHCDVKPGNFCINDKGMSLAAHAMDDEYFKAIAPELMTTTLTLVDFGFSQIMSREAFSDGEFGGTPDYSSTRILNSQPVGPSDDLESLGYMFLELWLGCMPWDVTRPASPPSPQQDPKQQPPKPSSFHGWDHKQLRGFAVKREAAWQNLCKEDAVPHFLQVWTQKARSCPPGTQPDYLFYELLLHREAFKANAELQKCRDRGAVPGQCSPEE